MKSAYETSQRHKLSNDIFVVPAAGQEDPHKLLECGDKDVQRKLQHHRAHRAAEHDHHRGWLRDLGDAAAFDHQAAKNPDDREQDASDAGDVHELGLCP